MACDDLRSLFLDRLRDTYAAETVMIEILPRLVGAARSADVKGAFRVHIEETREHLKRLEAVLRSLGETPAARDNKAVRCLVEEGEEIEAGFGGSEALDAGLISTAQTLTHYEITRYGTLLAWARQLGLEEAAALLRDTLVEEQNTDAFLSEIAEDHLAPRLA